MTALTLNNVTNLQETTNAQNTINNNSAATVTAMNKSLAKDGSDSQMSGTLDMNSNQIINLPNPATAQSPLRLEDLNTFVGGGTISNIPPGGTTGQVLQKTSDSDFAVEWSNTGVYTAGTNISINGSNVVSTSATPTFTTVNGLTIDTTTGTLDLADSKTLTIDNSLELAGTDSTKMTFPTSSDTVVGLAATQTLTNKTLSGATLSGTIAGSPTLSGSNFITNSNLSQSTANTIVGNPTGSSASKTDFTIGSLTQKSSPASTDLILIQDQAASGALKYATVASVGTGGAGVSSLLTLTGSIGNQWGLMTTSNNVGISTTNPPFAFGLPINLQLNASVASNLLTVAVKGNNGSDPSATNPVLIPFRDSSISAGDPTWVAVESALSISTNATGATLGTVASQPFRFWVVAFNNAGTVVLGLINCFKFGGAVSTNQIYSLQPNLLASSTGISGSATSVGTFYTPNGTSLSSKAFCILGFIEYEAGLATPGTYASAPTRIQLFGPGIKKPGECIQNICTGSANRSTSVSSTTLTATGLTLSVSPTNLCNPILIEARGGCSTGQNSGAITAQIYRGAAVVGVSNVPAFASQVSGYVDGWATMLGWDLPGVTSSVSYTVYIAANTTLSTPAYWDRLTQSNMNIQELMG